MDWVHGEETPFPKSPSLASNRLGFVLLFEKLTSGAHLAGRNRNKKTWVQIPHWNRRLRAARNCYAPLRTLKNKTDPAACVPKPAAQGVHSSAASARDRY